MTSATKNPYAANLTVPPKVIPRPAAEPATAESALEMGTKTLPILSVQRAERGPKHRAEARRDEPRDDFRTESPKGLDARHPKLIPWAGPVLETQGRSIPNRR